MLVVFYFIVFFMENTDSFASHNLKVDAAKLDYALPTPPANVAASDGTELDCIRVSWTGNPQAKCYRVFRAKNAPAKGSRVNSPTIYPQGNQTLWIADYKVVAGIVYYYYVCAEDGNGKLSERSKADKGFSVTTANGKK